MIKAYHAIGTGVKTPDYRAIQAELFDRVAAKGAILPATHRLGRAEMKRRCLQTENELLQACRKESPNAFRAIQEMAEEVIRTLPEDGDERTKFTCLDLLAGDLDRIFLTVERWFGNIENGFVFDAEDLIRNGAVVRERDVLEEIHVAVEQVCKRKYATVATARRSIERAIRQAVADRSYRGRAAIIHLEDECVGRAFCGAEVVWPGPLPLDAAVEAWRDGVQVFPT